jgi:ATP-dependent Clp protease ATP-binding subunit ClpA
MSQDAPHQDAPTLQALTPEQLDQVAAFFKKRLVGQPEIVQTLTNVLYKQNALLKRALEHQGSKAVGIPADPTVLLLMGGSWGKSLAARLIPMALQKLDYGSLTVLKPLPQDPEGSLELDPRALAAPFATVVVEHIEIAREMNARFVSNLAHLIETGMVALIEEQTVHPVPLGLCTIILTTNIADQEIRQTLNPQTRLGFLRPDDDQAVDAETMYQAVHRICQRALDQLPRELLRHVDETVVLRPLNQDDLRQIFDLEITHYEQAMFPGRELQITFKGDAKAQLFAQARENLKQYGAHALRRVLQHHIDPLVYRAYNAGTLTEADLDTHHVVVGFDKGQIKARLEQDT